MRFTVPLICVALLAAQDARAGEATFLNALIRSDGFTRDYADYVHCRAGAGEAVRTCEALGTAMLRRLIADGADPDRARALVASLVAAADDMADQSAGGSGP